MRNRLIIAGLLCLALPLLAQEPDQAASMRWVKHMTPGAAHQFMATSAGKFKTLNRLWMDPSGEPTESEGMVENTMVLGGRFLRSTYTGTMVGMVFEGIASTGFDNKKNAFQMSWMDNMGTSMSLLTGTYDEATHTITYTGPMYDAMSDKDIDFKIVLRFENKDKYTLEIFMPGDVKTIEMIHTRVE